MAQSKWQMLNKYLLNEHVTQGGGEGGSRGQGDIDIDKYIYIYIDLYIYIADLSCGTAETNNIVKQLYSNVIFTLLYALYFIVIYNISLLNALYLFIW